MRALLVTAAVFLGTLFVADRVLGLAGFPSEQPLPLAHAPNHAQPGRGDEFSYTIRTNRLGIRYREVPLKKRPGEYRVVAIGDSFTEGLGVDAEQTFPALLEKRFSEPGREVAFVNCGLIGAGPAEYARIFDRIGLRYEPDAALVVLHSNDLVDVPDLTESELQSGEGWLVPKSSIPNSKRGRIKSGVHALFPRTYTLAVGALRTFRHALKHKGFVEDVSERARKQGISEQQIVSWARSLPPDYVNAVEEDRLGSYLLSHALLWPDIWFEGLDIYNEPAEKKWHALEVMLSHIADVCRERGITLAVAYSPAAFQYDPGYVSPSERFGVRFRKGWLHEESEFEKRLARWAEARGVPFLDLTPGFREEAARRPGTLNFKMDPHWNARGQEWAAELLARWILSDRRPLKIPLDRVHAQEVERREP